MAAMTFAVIALALAAQGGSPTSASMGLASPLASPAPWAGVLEQVKGPLLRWREERAVARRAEARAPPGPLSSLAASQVGYAPAMTKHFTSTREFRSFRVVRERDGAVAFTGGGAVRTFDTEILGGTKTVWIGDFSGLRVAGRYLIVADNGLSSHPFDVGVDVFDRVVRATQRWFYFQRAFTAIVGKHAEGPWTHPTDAEKAPRGVIKGWHDAGDLTIYNASTSAALFWMLEAYNDFAPDDDDTNIPESGNGIPDLLDEIRWGLDWMLSVQEPSGGFASSTCLDRYGPYGTNSPNNVPRYSPGEVGTLATARAVGILAYASATFRGFDPAFADRCLQAAQRGYAYLRAREGQDTDGPSCPAYRADGNRKVGRQVRMLASAGMLLATGDVSFNADFDKNYEEIQHIPDYNNVNGFAGALYLRAPAGRLERKAAIRRQFRELAATAAADGSAHPYQWSSHYYWGSISNGFHRSGMFSIHACLEDPSRASDCEQSLANVHYSLGRNSLQHAYVSGLPGVTQGMNWSFHQWLKTLDATPHNFPGMVAGGPLESPDKNDRSYPGSRPYPTWGYWGDPRQPRDGETPVDARYTDNDSWSTNEVAVNWQAAALYNFFFARRVARTMTFP